MTISRRKFMTSTSAGVLAGGMMMGLGGRVLAQEPGLMKIGFGARGVLSLDPQSMTQGADKWPSIQIHEMLVRRPDGRNPKTNDEFLPGLALSWSSSEDARTWTFQLREGVQFHKGYGEFTSEDVKYTFDRVRDADRIGRNHVMYSNIREVTTDGPYSVVFHLDDPDPLFLISTQTFYTGNIMSKRAIEDKGDEAIELDPIGTGPYMLETVHTSQAEGVTLVAFPDYWGAQPATERLQFQYLADSTARTLALLSEDVQMIEGIRSPGWVNSIRQRNPDINFDIAAPGSFFTIHFNLTQKPFDDLRIRQAFMYALNRDQMVQAMAPFGVPTYGLIPPSYPGGATAEDLPEELRYGHDPDRARELLAEAGYGDGLSFTAFTSKREDFSAMMLIVQEQLRAVGIDMNLELRDHTAFHAEQNSGANSLSQHSASLPAAPTYPFNYYLSSGASVENGGRNFSRYGVAMEGIDDLLEQAMNATDLDRHIELVRQMDEKVLHDLPLIHLMTTGFVIARNPDVDLGFEVESGADWQLNQATMN